MRLAYSLGESASTWPPRSAKRARIFGSARAASISRLSASMISAGGRADAGPRARLETRHKVAKWRDVGKRRQPCRGGHSQRAQPAGPDMFDGGGHVVEHDMHLSANEIGQRRGRSPIRNMQHVDAGHHFEQLAGHVRNGTVARRSKTDLARMSLSVGDDPGTRLGRK